MMMCNFQKLKNYFIQCFFIRVRPPHDGRVATVSRAANSPLKLNRKLLNKEVIGPSEPRDYRSKVKGQMHSSRQQG